MKCQGCEDEKAEFEDPSNPPLDEGICLGKNCYITCLQDRELELEDELAKVRNKLAKLK